MKMLGIIMISVSVWSLSFYTSEIEQQMTQTNYASNVVMFEVGYGFKYTL